MADIAKAALGNRVLESIGVKAGSQAAATADTTLVEELIDAAHEKLRKFGLVPFATSAIPSWAQDPLRMYVAEMIKPYFGQQPSAAAMQHAERELARQVSGYKHKRTPPREWM